MPHDHHGHNHNHDHGHSHGHGHGHGHGHHHHVPKNFDSAFALGAFLNLAFVGAELSYGYMAKSLALISDAVHNFADVIGLLLAWGAAWLARRGPTDERTFGYRRASILAALVNSCLLFLAIGGIIIEALQRFARPEAIETKMVIGVAAAGIVINMATAMLFWKGQKHDINLRGAFMHMVADAAISLGVVVSGAIIWLKGWQWMDPAISLVIAVIVLAGCWGLAKEALHLSLDGVPKHINRKNVLFYLHELPGVTGVHDLHIWAMSTTEVALTCHLLRPGHPVDDVFLQKVALELQELHQIHHVTIQVEQGNTRDQCRLAPDGVV
jgi:cobalt-zinc-cadmium efflux system protein